MQKFSRPTTRQVLYALAFLPVSVLMMLLALTPDPSVLETHLVDGDSKLLFQLRKQYTQNSNAPQDYKYQWLLDLQSGQYRPLRSDEVPVLDPTVLANDPSFFFQSKVDRIAQRSSFDNPNSMYRFIHREDAYDPDPRHRTHLTYRMDRNGFQYRGSLFQQAWVARESDPAKVGKPLPKEDMADGLVLGPFKISETMDRIVDLPQLRANTPSNCILRRLSNPKEIVNTWPASAKIGVQVIGDRIYSISPDKTAIEFHSLRSGEITRRVSFQSFGTTSYRFVGIDEEANLAFFNLISPKLVAIDLATGNDRWSLDGQNMRLYDPNSKCFLAINYVKKLNDMKVAMYSALTGEPIPIETELSAWNQVHLAAGKAFVLRDGVLSTYSLPDGKLVNTYRTPSANQGIALFGMWLGFAVWWAGGWRIWNATSGNWRLGVAVGLVGVIACILCWQRLSAEEFGSGVIASRIAPGVAWCVTFVLVQWIWLGSGNRPLRHLVGIFLISILTIAGFLCNWVLELSAGQLFVQCSIFFLLVSFLVLLSVWGARGHATDTNSTSSNYQINTRDLLVWTIIIAVWIFVLQALIRSKQAILSDFIVWLTVQVFAGLLAWWLLSPARERKRKSWWRFFLRFTAFCAVLIGLIFALMLATRPTMFSGPKNELSTVMCSLIGFAVFGLVNKLHQRSDRVSNQAAPAAQS